MKIKKPIQWVGSSLDDVKAFPVSSRRKIGFQLDRVQRGLEPEDWKPFNQIGAGVKEIRIRDPDGIYRVIYVAKFEEAVYVLHAFQKKTQTTAEQDKAIANLRYKRLLALRSKP